MISHFKFIFYLKKDYIKSIYILIFILFLVNKFNIFIYLLGFCYCGIETHIIALCIFIIFSIIPIDKISNKANNFINQISKFTSGIYYLHILVKRYLEGYVSLISNQTLSGSIIIYIISFLICLIGNAYFRNTKLIHLFK